MPVDSMLANPVFFRHVLEELYDGVYVVDTSRKILFWNKGAERITGYASEKVLGKSCADNILMHVDNRGKKLCLEGCPLHETLKDGLDREASVFLHHCDGYRVPVLIRISPLRDTEGRIIGAVEVFSDNTKLDRSMRTIRKLEKEAFRDPLTSVMNRRYGHTFISLKLHEMRSLELSPLGLLFLDIDHFKKFNDLYGHQMGDNVLVMVAGTLKNILRSEDLVCRWGGEEFVIALPESSLSMLENVAERIRILVGSSVFTENMDSIRVTVSIGGSLGRIDDSADTLVHRADQMMYRSKQGGRNMISIEGVS